MYQRISILFIVYLGYITLFVPIHVGEGKAEEGNYEDFADEMTKRILYERKEKHPVTMQIF